MDKKIKQKLKVDDYVFEIDGQDIIKAEVEYEFIKISSVSMEGITLPSIPAISLELKGVDANNNEAWFCLELEISLEQLNNYNDQPVDITKFLLDSEAFIKKPNMKYSRELDLYLPTNNIDDIYHNLTSIWVIKKNPNDFIFKVCVPSDGLFAYFRVNFN